MVEGRGDGQGVHAEGHAQVGHGQIDRQQLGALELRGPAGGDDQHRGVPRHRQNGYRGEGREVDGEEEMSISRTNFQSSAVKTMFVLLVVAQGRRSKPIDYYELYYVALGQSANFYRLSGSLLRYVVDSFQIYTNDNNKQSTLTTWFKQWLARIRLNKPRPPTKTYKDKYKKHT